MAIHLNDLSLPVKYSFAMTFVTLERCHFSYFLVISIIEFGIEYFSGHCTIHILRDICNLETSNFIEYKYQCLYISLPLDLSCRSRLATLNEKLSTLERRVEYIEARVSTCK